MKAGTRILVVEDDRSIARLVELELEHRGFAVRCACDGPSGLRAASEFRPAAIVLDIMLPGLDGVGVLARLRTVGNGVPVIMLTARGDPQQSRGRARPAMPKGTRLLRSNGSTVAGSTR